MKLPHLLFDVFLFLMVLTVGYQSFVWVKTGIWSDVTPWALLSTLDMSPSFLITGEWGWAWMQKLTIWKLDHPLWRLFGYGAGMFGAMAWFLNWKFKSAEQRIEADPD